MHIYIYLYISQHTLRFVSFLYTMLLIFVFVRFAYI